MYRSIGVPACRRTNTKSFRRYADTSIRRYLAVLFFALCLLPCRFSEAADVYLGLQAYSQGGKPLGVGLGPFTTASANPESAALASKLRAIIREDLLFEGLFSITEGGPAPAAQHLDAVVWSGLGAQVVVAGAANLQGPSLQLECQIDDVGTGKLLFAKEGTSVPQASRRLAHLLADQLTFQLSGQVGVAHTRIVFVNNHTHHKEIYVMDYDGEDPRQMTFDHSIDLLPKWSPDGKEIAFNSYRQGNPDAYLLDFPGGSVRTLSMRQGLNTAPNWAPDGKSLALTISRGADPELYVIDPFGHIQTRLTYTPGVDTSPSFSPNGQQIAFVSDRWDSRALRDGCDRRQSPAADLRSVGRCAGLVSARRLDRLRTAALRRPIRYLAD